MSAVTKWTLLRINSRALQGKHRASYCLQRRLKAGDIKVTKSEANKARYRNLRPCGSVWVCPVCAANISRKRAGEIALAVKKWQADGGKVAMATYTHKHSRVEPLADNLALLKRAYRQMQMQRAYRDLRTWQHQVQSMEITFGAHGWHCHYHALLFYRTLVPDLQDKLYKIWSGFVVAKEGVGVLVTYPKDSRIIGDYMAKVQEWGMAEELALSELKEGGAGYMDFLLEGEFERAREYALATAGRNKMTKSRGFDDAFGIDTATDEELSIEPNHDAEFAQLGAKIWAWVLQDDKRAYVLELAESADTQEEFFMMLESEQDDE